MSGVLFQPPRAVPVNSSGRPYPGARRHFYAAGTTTPIAVYSDSALTVVAANPQVADSAGKFAPVYIDPTVGTYKTWLTTSTGVQIEPADDNIPSYVPLPQAAVGASLYPRSARESEAAVTPAIYAHPYGDVRRYGAKGDGVTDDTAAIQACIKYVQGNTNTGVHGSESPGVGPGVVYFPQGTYLVSSALLVSLKICILGEGQSEFSYGSRLIQTSANTDLFRITPSAGSTSFSIENMVLRSTAGVGTGHLVNMARTGGGSVNSQRYVNTTFGQPQAMALYLAGDDITIKNCLFDVSQQSGNGIQLGTASSAATNVKIEGNNFFNHTNTCVKLINVEGLVFSGNLVSQPNALTKTPVVIDGITDTPTAAKYITISGNTVRGARTFVGVTNPDSVTIAGNTAVQTGIGAGEVRHLLSFGGSGYVTITGNTFDGTHDSANFYNDTSCTTLRGVISGNTFVNRGGPGDALGCTKFVGRLLPNYFIDFVGQQMGEKRSTTGAPVNPGSITSGSQFGYSVTVAGAAIGDTVDVGTISNAWIAQSGIEVRAFVSAANTVRVEYRNGTAGSVSVSAHDIWTEVTR